ncbi:hypothetical protein PUN28_013622 [Cardiocondyla obscurior]|uniref:Transmembrane protein n=1 Tax=Cardiocondyla obscurior TaxID=286306 RepID=A0AAW2F6H1_9HYME
MSQLPILSIIQVSLDTSVNQDLIEILVKEIPLSGAHGLECRRRSQIRRLKHVAVASSLLRPSICVFFLPRFSAFHSPSLSSSCALGITVRFFFLFFFFLFFFSPRSSLGHSLGKDRRGEGKVSVGS